MSAIAYFTGWITINNQGLMEPSSHWPLLTLMQSPTNFEVDGKQPTLQTCKATSKLVIRQNGVPQHLWYAAPSINHPYCWTLTIPCGKSEFSNEQWPQQSNWHLLGCKLNSDAVTVWIKQVGTFAVQPIGGQGFFGCMERFASRLLLQSWIIQLVYVDDLQLAAAKFRKFGYLAVPNHLRKSWDIWEISIYTLKKDSCHYEHLQYHGNLKAPRPMPNPHPPAP